jgi:hypothetical protein
VERIVGAVGYPRSDAATFFDQANPMRAPKRLRREMDRDHRPAKARSDNRDIDVANGPPKNSLFRYHNQKILPG